MPFDYSSMATSVTTQLTNYGQAMALRRVSAGIYDPILGATAGGLSADLPVVGVLNKISTEYAKAFAVEVNDRMAVIGGATPPLQSDLLVIAGEPWQIIRIEPVDPGGIALAYRLQVRQ